QIARRHDVPLGRPARGVAKVAITQPDLRGQTIELSSESLLATRETLGQYHASMIARLHDDPAQEIFNPDLIAELDEHFRASHAPGPFADRQLVLERKAALANAIEDDIGGHDL